MNEINWEEIRKIVDDTAAKRDRKVMIFISPHNRNQRFNRALAGY